MVDPRMNDLILYQPHLVSDIPFFDYGIKPHQDLIWDDEKQSWIPPIDQFDSENFQLKWNNAHKRWLISFKENESKKNRTYHLWPLVNKNNDSLYAEACSTNDYMIEPIDRITHGNSELESILLSSKSIDSSEDGQVIYPKIKKHVPIVDVLPFARITYQEWDDEDIFSFEQAIKVHPQCAARTIHELFRLILEWSWSYSELANSEPMAKISYDVLNTLQIPQNVVDELLSQRPQAVARFITGDTDALVEYEFDVDQLPDFSLWISYIYTKYMPVIRKQNQHLDRYLRRTNDNNE